MQTLMLLNVDLLNNTRVKLLHRLCGAWASQKSQGFSLFPSCHADEEDEYLPNIDVEPSTHHFPPWLRIWKGWSCGAPATWGDSCWLYLWHSQRVKMCLILTSFGAKIDVATSTSLGSAAHGVQRRRSSMWKLWKQQIIATLSKDGL